MKSLIADLDRSLEWSDLSLFGDSAALDEPPVRRHHRLRAPTMRMLVLLPIFVAALIVGLTDRDRTVHAQSFEVTATTTPTTLPTSIPSSTETVALVPAPEMPTVEMFKALVRARIRLLIRAKMLAAATPTVTESVSYTVTIPLLMNGASSSPEAVDVSSPTQTAIPPTPLPTETPTPAAAGDPTSDGALRTARIPILMYHYLSVPPDDADIYRRDLSVSPDLFAQHLDRLRLEGYTTIRLDDLVLHLTEGAPLPAKPVILTFDDGYRDNYTNAFPLLKERGMTATFFLVTDFIDAGLPDYLSWDMVREMYAGGMSIQSHGRNHTSLKGRDDDYLIWQALGSLETIEYELGVRPHFISYPAGQYDENTIRIFASAHYWAGATTVQGATHRSDDLFQLRRVRIRGTTSADELVRLLALDW